MGDAPIGTPSAPAVVRDRATWLAYFQIGLFGYFLYAFGPSSPSRSRRSVCVATA